MTETQMLTVAATLVAALFGLLATIVGWKPMPLLVGVLLR